MTTSSRKHTKFVPTIDVVTIVLTDVCWDLGSWAPQTTVEELCEQGYAPRLCAQAKVSIVTKGGDVFTALSEIYFKEGE